VRAIIEDAVRRLTEADPLWVAAAVAIYALSVVAGGGRWRVLVGVLGGRIPLLYATLAVIAATFVNNVTPTGRLGGEACRIAITRMRGHLSLSLAALGTLGDRLCDIAVLGLMAIVAVPALGPALGPRLLPIAAGVGVIALVVAIFGRWARAMLHAWITSSRRQLRDLRLGAAPAAMVAALSVASWSLDVLRLIVVAAAFQVSLTPTQGATLVVTMVLGGLVPTVGGLGAIEGGLLGALALFGIPLDTAIAITTVERAISYGLSTVVGGLAVALLGGRSLLRASLRRPSAAPAPSPPPEAGAAGSRDRP
jgi:glycosyltransferase 2 family protein